MTDSINATLVSPLGATRSKPTLRRGSRGASVVELQRQLAAAGFSPGALDGDFGPKTEQAVRAFQNARQLMVDGIVGPQTWNALGVHAGPSPDPTDDPSLQQLRSIMPALSVSRAGECLPHLTRAMDEFTINTRLRRAAFIAQLAHESGQLRHFEEIADGSAYEGRRDLGNTQPGDGKRYKGRGPIQLTGRSNYRKAGAALGLDLEGNPRRAADLDVGFRIAGWYWADRRLNALADAQDFERITRGINGGLNGYEDRLKYYRRALQVL